MSTPTGRVGAALIAAAVFGVSAVNVTIDNNAPRMTDTGIILDGHDGRLVRNPPGAPAPGYYLFTIEYGLCEEPKNQGCDQTPDKCGFQ